MTEADDKPAAPEVRDFIRAYVKQYARRILEGEVRRPSLHAADRAGNPKTDEFAVPRQ